MDEKRFDETNKVGILGMVGNLFLLIIKGIVGFASHSQSMVADSFNSAGDIFASFMTFIGNKISSVPNDDDHNFGHGKAEYIFSMFIGLSMIFVSIKLLFDAVHTIIFGSNLEFSWFLVAVCIITITIKLILYFYSKAILKKYNNILLEANVADHRNDCIITSFTLLSVLLSIKGWYLFDSITGIGISVWIGFTGIKIFIESYNILMDISVDEDTKDTIISIINKYSKIEKIVNISSSPAGYKYIIFVTIGVDGNMSTFESHELADLLENDIGKLEKVYNTIVHVEPV